MASVQPSTPSIATAASNSTTLRRIVVASVAGNAMEWYDFFVYGTAAALVFGQLFFPANADPLIGTLGAFAAFAMGFIARPLGGVVFGHIGDRYGRRASLVWTLLIMGFATFGIGLLPTYDRVGLWAPAALVALRLLQGVASGGEWGGGVLMISESAPPEKRGYYAAWSQLGVGGGFVLSSAAFLAVQALPHDQFISWGWRLPFLASILIFAIGVYIRRSLPESREFESAEKAGTTSHMPVLEAIRRYPKEILMAMGLRVAENGGAYIFLAFSLVYGKFAGIPNSTMLTGVMLAMVIEMGAMLAWGKHSDRIGRKPVYIDRRDLARTDGVSLLLAARHAFHSARVARARARHGRVSRRDDRHAACPRRRVVRHRGALFRRRAWS
jgi:MFS transporter, MHS family, shikimate and dehydroshikimate transport protein